MRARLAQQEGVALVTAVIVMMLMMSVGLATYSTVDTQSQQSQKERSQESAFNLTEGALQQQGYVLGANWPSQASQAYPTCSFPGTPTAGQCPQPNNLANASGTGSFTQADYKAGVSWETQVRDNPNGGTFYDSTVTEASNPRWDANGDRQLWIRATSTVRGRKRTLVALLRRERLNEGFPRSTITAGYFNVTNNGNKTIIDTTGSQVIVRCQGQAFPTPCADYNASKGQVSPADSVVHGPSTPSAMNAAQVDRFKSAAQSANPPTYFTSCPASLTGAIVFIDLPTATECQYQGNLNYNSAAQPGVVIMRQGTLTLRGGVTFYGLLYLRNEQGSTGIVADIGGNGGVVGSVTIDGAGGLDAGSNGNSGTNTSNITYASNAFNSLASFGTAGLVQSTWRELPPNTP